MPFDTRYNNLFLNFTPIISLVNFLVLWNIFRIGYQQPNTSLNSVITLEPGSHSSSLKSILAFDREILILKHALFFIFKFAQIEI